MRHFIINIQWKDSEFTGSVWQDSGVPVVKNLSYPDFNEFFELAEGSLEVLNPFFSDPDGDFPEWYKNGEYDFTYHFSDMASLLKAYSQYVPLATLAKATQINKGLLSHYANRLKQPRDKKSEHIIQKLHEIGTRLCNCTLEQQEVLTIKPTTPQKA